MCIRDRLSHSASLKEIAMPNEVFKGIQGHFDPNKGKKKKKKKKAPAKGSTYDQVMNAINNINPFN